VIASVLNLAAAALLAAPAGSVPAEAAPLAAGSGFSISTEEFDSAWAALPLAAQAQFVQKEEARADFMLAYLEEALYAKAAREEGLDRDPLILARIRAATQTILSEAWLDRHLRNPIVTEERLWREYEEVKTSFPAPQWYEARQILVMPGAGSGEEAQRKIERIEHQLGRGARFEDMARKYSEDPKTASAGGDLGRFKKGTMVREVEEALDRLEPGQVSPPVFSEYGIHLLQLIAKQSQPYRSRQELEPLLTFRILTGDAGILQKKQNELLRELKTRWDIQVDWQRLKRMD
jgi:parvulin-like peptidyl-prolyl isomerase